MNRLLAVQTVNIICFNVYNQMILFFVFYEWHRCRWIYYCYRGCLFSIVLNIKRKILENENLSKYSKNMYINLKMHKIWKNMQNHAKYWNICIKNFPGHMCPWIKLLQAFGPLKRNGNLLMNQNIDVGLRFIIGLLARLNMLEKQRIVQCSCVFVCVLYLTTLFKQCMFFPQKCAHHQI